MNGNFKPPPIFVISLPRSVERRDAISARLKNLGLHFTFFDAIDGADFYTDARYFNAEKCKAHEKRIMNAGEVGCALSHIGVYKKIEEQKLPFALVLEDDALISGDLPRVLRELEPHIKPNDFITIEHCDIYCRFKQQTLFAEYRLVKPLLIEYGSMGQSCGYIITREAAQKIARVNFPVFVPADCWGVYKNRINFKGVIPSRTVIKQNAEFESTIIQGKRSFNGRSTARSLLFYRFYTRCPVGIYLKEKRKLVLKLLAKNKF